MFNSFSQLTGHGSVYAYLAISRRSALLLSITPETYLCNHTAHAPNIALMTSCITWARHEIVVDLLLQLLLISRLLSSSSSSFHIVPLFPALSIVVHRRRFVMLKRSKTLYKMSAMCSPV